jgi:hypothetical protein
MAQSMMQISDKTVGVERDFGRSVFPEVVFPKNV